MIDAAWCPRCGQRKPLNHFPPVPSTARGVGPYCHPCKRDHARERRATPEGLEASREAARRYRARERAKRAAAERPESPGVASRIFQGAAQ